MNNGTFDFNAFLKESKEVLLSPKAYFSTMKLAGGMTEPLIKAVIYGAIAGAFAFIWNLLKIGAVSGGLFGGAVGVMAFFAYIFFAVIGLFIGAVILLVISSICKGSTDFEANVRVSAAVLVIMPVSAFFGFAGHFNIYLGVIISMIINLFALWLIYNALIEALKTKPETTKIVGYVLAVIFILMMLGGIFAARKANQFMNQFKNTDMKELMKNMEKK
jgi:hypothetical protein